MSVGKNYLESGKTPTSVGLRLELPKIDEGILNDPSRLDQLVTLKMEGVDQIQKGITDTLGWLDSVASWLRECQPLQGDSSEEKVRKAMLLRIRRNEISEHLRKVGNYVDECLGAKEPIYRTAAAIAYLNYMFDQEFTDHQTALGMLEGLKQKGLLIEAPAGLIMIGYQRFNVSSSFDLDQNDLKAIQDAVARFSRRFMQLTHQRREETAQKLAKEATLTFEQFQKGVPGTFLLEVPSEKMESDHNVPDKGHHRGGGNLYLEVRGRDIFPVNSTGSIERMVANMIEFGIRLPYYTLMWDAPPGAGKNFRRVQEGVMDTRDISEGDAEIYVRKMQSLWHLIKRGIDARAWREKMSGVMKSFAEKSTITPEEFFGLDGDKPKEGEEFFGLDGGQPKSQPKEGIAYLQFEGAFKHKGRVFYNIFFIVERSKEEDSCCLEVLDAPEHVKELLEPLALEGKLKEGKNFTSLPLTLQKILRAIRNKTDLIVEVNRAD